MVSMLKKRRSSSRPNIHFYLWGSPRASDAGVGRGRGVEGKEGNTGKARSRRRRGWWAVGVGWWEGSHPPLFSLRFSTADGRALWCHPAWLGAREMGGRGLPWRSISAARAFFPLPQLPPFHPLHCPVAGPSVWNSFWRIVGIVSPHGGPQLRSPTTANGGNNVNSKIINKRLNIGMIGVALVLFLLQYWGTRWYLIHESRQQRHLVDWSSLIRV